MAHRLPNLPYGYRDLEPHIDKRTMMVHHDKHHQAYVDNLNKALDGYPDLQSKSTMELLSNLDSVPEEIRVPVRNNGGGHANHSMFWPSMSFRGGGQPDGKLAFLHERRQTGGGKVEHRLAHPRGVRRDIQ